MNLLSQNPQPHQSVYPKISMILVLIFLMCFLTWLGGARI